MRKNAVPRERIEFIASHSNTHTAKEIADLLGIGTGAVANTARTNGIKFTKGRKRHNIHRKMAIFLYQHGFSIKDIHTMDFSDVTYSGFLSFLHENVNEEVHTLH